MVMLASAQVRTPMALSMQPGDPKYMDLRGFYGRDVAFKMESDEEFLASMGSYDRIRTCSPDIPKAYYEKAAELGMYIATAKPVVEGRLEMLHYLKEQSISFEYHRYGSITEEPASSF
jgi:RHH-type proline utilization regulon transcriptional repressor/proline dehydrogenase/delta 1-pyrroline-5-carboxylate dehydrogenase